MTFEPDSPSFRRLEEVKEAFRMKGYDRLKPLGKGGGSDVFRAVRAKDGMSVAVKIVRAETPDLARELFRKEVTALRSLSHENIVQLLDADAIQIGSSPVLREVLMFLVLELGEISLSDALNARGAALPARAAVEIVRRIADAVAFAHGREPKILHLDVKPGNILWFGKTWKLTDFNIARFIVNRGIGTEGFGSPQLRDSARPDVNEQDDVFGLAATLYWLLTRIPIGQWRVNHGWLPKPPGQLAGSVSIELSKIILAGLHPDRRFRYASAAAFGLDLQRWLDLKPTSPPVEHAWSRLSRPVRWNPAASAIIVVAAVVGSGVVVSRARIRDLGTTVAETKKAVQEKSLLADRMTRKARLAGHASDMKNAWDAWRNNSPSAMRAILDKYNPTVETGKPNSRRIEWQFLDRLGSASYLSFGAGGPTRAAAISPDKKSIILLSNDNISINKVTVFDVESGVAELKLVLDHPNVLTLQGDVVRNYVPRFGPSQAVAYHPSGRLAAATSLHYPRPGRDVMARDREGYGVVKVWDLAGGGEVFAANDAAIAGQAVLFSPDGKYLLCGGYNHAVLIWDLASGALKWTLAAHQRLNSRRLGPVGPPVEGVPRPKPESTGFAPVRFLRFGPRGATLIRSTDYNETVTSPWPPVGDGDSDDVIWPNQDGNFEVAVSENGNQLLVGNPASGSLALTSPKRSDNLTVRKPERYPIELKVPIVAVAVSADGVAVAGETGPVLYGMPARTRGGSILLLNPLKGLPGPPRSLSFSNDGKLLAGVSDAGVVIWDVKGRQEQKQLIEVLLEQAVRRNKRPSSFGTGRAWTVQMLGHQKLAVRSAETGEIKATFELELSGSPAWCCYGPLLAYAGEGRQLIVWDSTTGKVVCRMAAGTPQPEAMCFDDSGTRVVTVAGERLTFWSLETAAEIFSVTDVGGYPWGWLGVIDAVKSVNKKIK